MPGVFLAGAKRISYICPPFWETSAALSARAWRRDPPYQVCCCVAATNTPSEVHRMIQQTEIILFDEATSALDNITQTRIQQAIEHLKKNYTILIIAHRLSTIIHCDRILYLEDGKVAAEGTHEELLKKCAGYKELYEAEIEK